MNNRCIVSLATKNGRYVDGLARLSNSLRDNAYGIDFLGFIHEHSVGAQLHTENNYGFKVNAIQKAIDAGYTQILWLDCSVWAVAPVETIFNIIESNGYWFEGVGCWCEDYTNDETLNHFGMKKGKKTPMIQSGFMGYNVYHPIGKQLFEGFKYSCELGFFNGEWANHRHDQSCISAIVNKLKLPFSHMPEYVQYAGLYDAVLNEKIIFKCQGI